MEEKLNFELWEAAIGKLILACSRVEYEMIRLYEKRIPEVLYHRDSYLNRFDRAIKIAKASLDNGDEISGKLAEMKKFAEYRHLVAHNPIHYSNETDSWHIFDLKNNSKSVQINDLCEIAEEAKSLSIELCVLLRCNV